MKRQVEVGRLGEVQAAESARRHADNRRGRVRDEHGSAHDPRIRIERAAPVAIREHRGQRRATAVVLGPELGPKRQPDAECREEGLIGEEHRSALGNRSALGHQQQLRPAGGDAAEGVDFLDRVVHGIRVAHERPPLARSRHELPFDHRQPIGPLHRQRLEQNRRDQRPHCSRGADPAG